VAKPRLSLCTVGFALVLATVWVRCFEDKKVTLTSQVLLAIWAAACRRSIPRWGSVLIVATAPVISVPLYAAAETALQFRWGTARLAAGIADDPIVEAENFHPHYCELSNLHRVYRAFRVVERCCLHAQFDLWDPFGSFVPVGGWRPRSVANSTFELLFHLFGPMRGAYLGPYPTKREALWMMQVDGSIVDAPTWAQGRFKVAGREMRLPSNVRQWEAEPQDQPVRVAIFGGTCLLIHEQHDTDMYIRLVDLGGFGQFAKYHYTGPGSE